MSIKREETDNLSDSKQHPWSRSLYRVAWLLFGTMMFAPVAAHAGDGLGPFDRIFNSTGSAVNGVAVRVADLPDEHSSFMVMGVAFSPDDLYLAVTASDSFVNVWSLKTHQIVARLDRAFLSKQSRLSANNGTDIYGVNDPYFGNSIVFSPDGRWLASCSSPGEGRVVVRVWQTQRWTVVHDISANGADGSDAIQFAVDSHTLYRLIDRGGRPGEHLIAYDTKTWQETWSLRFEDFSGETLSTNPAGQLIAVGGTYWDIPAGIADAFQRAKATQDVPTVYIIDLQTHQTVTTLHPRAIGPMDWSPDGHRIAIANNGLQIFDVNNGRLLLDENLAKAGSMNVRISGNGKYVIESDFKGAAGIYPPFGVKIWNGQHSARLQTIPGDMPSIDVSKDSKYLAIGETGHTSIWKLK